MACSFAGNSSHPLRPCSFSVKDDMLFVGCHGHLGYSSASDDALGELREEEIVWGESEIRHHYVDTSGHEAGRGDCKIGTAFNNSRDRHRPTRHRSLLISRQTEMQAETWSDGSTISAVSLVAKQSGNVGSVMANIKAATDHQNEEVGMNAGRIGGASSREDIEMQQQTTDELIPPHELLARQYAASAATSFSVVQGAGCTLKGRDLRRLRNEVWRQTGFVD